MEISRWITHAALWDSDKVAIHFEGDSLTYGGFAQRIAKLAGVLRELGVGAGDRVAHLGYNGPEILELLFACARLGAALTPLNWRLAAPEYSFIVGDAKPSLLFVEQPFYDQAQTLAAAFSGLGVVALDAPHLDWLAYEQILASANPVEPERNDLDDATVLIVYTSGTTGRPKGAMLPQSALFWNAVNATMTLGMTRADHILTAIRCSTPAASIFKPRPPCISAPPSPSPNGLTPARRWRCSRAGPTVFLLRCRR